MADAKPLQIHWTFDPLDNPIGKSGFNRRWDCRAYVHRDDGMPDLCRLGWPHKPLRIFREKTKDADHKTAAPAGYCDWWELVLFLRDAHKILTMKKYADVIGDDVDKLMGQLGERLNADSKLWRQREKTAVSGEVRDG